MCRTEAKEIRISWSFQMRMMVAWTTAGRASVKTDQSLLLGKDVVRDDPVARICPGPKRPI